MRLFHEHLICGTVIVLLSAIGLMVSEDPELPHKVRDSLFIKGMPPKQPALTVTHVDWSSDGKQLMIQARGGDTAAVCLSIHQLEGSGYIPQWSEMLRGAISHATFSADGTSAVLATLSGELWWIDVETSAATELMKVPAAFHFVTTGISRDGQLLAGATLDGDIHLFEPRRGNSNRLPQRLEGAITYLRFSNDSRKLLSTTTNGSLNVWDTESKVLLRQVENKNSTIVSSAAFLPDGNRVMSLSNSDEIEVRDVHTNLVQWTGGRGTFGRYGIGTIDVCAQGRVAVWGGGLNYRIVIWDLENQRVMHEIENPSVVLKAKLSPDGRRVAVAGCEQVVRVYDVMTGRELHRIDARRAHETITRT